MIKLLTLVPLESTDSFFCQPFFQGSTLVKFFTKFTKDIFNALVALLFIYEAINKLGKIFKKHPLQSRDNVCNVNATLASLNESWGSEEEFQSALKTAIDEQHGTEGPN